MQYIVKNYTKEFVSIKMMIPHGLKQAIEELSNKTGAYRSRVVVERIGAGYADLKIFTFDQKINENLLYFQYRL
jgi:predicted DNA-binding protein